MVTVGRGGMCTGIVEILAVSIFWVILQVETLRMF